MENQEFERVVQEAFDALPEKFRETIENVHIVVEDLPDPAANRRRGFRPGTLLLGLYEGIPLKHRGTSYGMYPSVPDKITLYRKNIEAVAGTDEEVRACIRDTLIHEIGHYFGMSEAEIRRAGY